MNNLHYWAIVPAAGLGLRMKSSVPKQYLSYHGMTVLEHTLKQLLANSYIHKIVVVLNEEDSHWEKLNFDHQEQIITTIGGDSRAQSVWQGLKKLEGMADEKDWVLVHDAVRPCISQKAINHLIAQINTHPVGGILGLPVHDTLKNVDESGNIKQTLSRHSTWRAQTPQMFRYKILLEAMENALNNNHPISDEASAIEFMKLSHRIIQGDARNIKMTTPEDLSLLEKFLEKE